MYTQIGVVDTAELLARAAIMRDRERFLPIFIAADKYVAASGLIIAGDAALRALTENAALRALTENGARELTPEDFAADYFSSQGAAHARGLADAIYAADPNGLAHYTTMATSSGGTHWVILVDSRPLFTITALPVERGAQAAMAFTPKTVRSKFQPGLELKCISRELARIRVFTELCDPTALDRLGELLNYAASLSSEEAPHSEEAPKEAVTGGDKTVSHAREFLIGPNRVIIAPIFSKTDSIFTKPRIQIVVSDPLDREAQVAVDTLSKEGYAASYTIENPAVPGDPRLRCATVYVEGDRDQRRAVLDIYNSGAHELIPYVEGCICPARHRDVCPHPVKIGAPFAALRFLSVSLWTLRMLGQRVDTAAAAAMVQSQIRAMTPAVFAAIAAGEFDRLFPQNYIGRVESADTARKREGRLAGMGSRAKDGARPRFYPPYLPAKNAARMGGTIFDYVEETEY